MDEWGYYARVDAFIRALPWSDARHPEHVGAVAARLEWTAVEAFVVALDAEALGYAELMPPERKLDKRPELYRVRLAPQGYLRLAELGAFTVGAEQAQEAVRTR